MLIIRRLKTWNRIRVDHQKKGVLILNGKENKNEKIYVCTIGSCIVRWLFRGNG